MEPKTKEILVQINKLIDLIAEKDDDPGQLFMHENAFINEKQAQAPIGECSVLMILECLYEHFAEWHDV